MVVWVKVQLVLFKFLFSIMLFELNLNEPLFSFSSNAINFCPASKGSVAEGVWELLLHFVFVHKTKMAIIQLLKTIQ